MSGLLRRIWLIRFRQLLLNSGVLAGTLWLVNQHGIVFDQIGAGVTGGLLRPAVLTEVLMLGAYLARVLLDGAYFRPWVRQTYRNTISSLKGGSDLRRTPRRGIAIILSGPVQKLVASNGVTR